MRVTVKLLPVLFSLFAGCAEKELSKEQAASLIKQHYPRVIDTYIYAGDPKYAKLMQDAGLDADGYVTVKKTKRFGDTTGWLSFTSKAVPYLLVTSEEDKKTLVQKVKAGEEQLMEIVSVKQDEDGRSAIVSYTTKVSTTPFSKLIKLNDGAVKQRTTRLIRYNDAWHLKDKGTP